MVETKNNNLNGVLEDAPSEPKKPKQNNFMGDDLGDDDDEESEPKSRADLFNGVDSIADSQATLATIDTHAVVDDELRESATSNLEKRKVASGQATGYLKDCPTATADESNSIAANVLFHPPAAYEEHSANSGSREGEEEDDDGVLIEQRAAGQTKVPAVAVNEPAPAAAF